MAPVAVWLEAQTHGDLSRAASAQFGWARGGNASETRAGNVHIRIGIIGVIGYVGERSAGFEFHPLGQIEGFVHAEREVDRSRPLNDADARRAETSDGRGFVNR